MGAWTDNTLRTTIYIKMDASDQLLLSEGVCRQLGIVSYHDSITSGKVMKDPAEVKPPRGIAIVPTIRVNLVKTVRIPANQGAVVAVQLSGCSHLPIESLLIGNRDHLQKETGLQVEDAVISVPESGEAQIVVQNRSGFTQLLAEGVSLAETEVTELEMPPKSTALTPELEPCNVNRTTFLDTNTRKAKLLSLLELPVLPPADLNLLCEFLADHHDVFSLEEGERGETDLVCMSIDTGDASPKK